MINYRSYNRQNGNVLLIILIAVGLFAALTYTVSFSTRNAKSLDDETMALSVSQVLDYASKIDNAVRFLMLENECMESEISFHFDSDGDGSLETDGSDLFYNNGSDTKCYVFDPDGASMTWKNIPSPIATDPVGIGDPDTTSQYYITAQNQLQDIGTTQASGNSNGTDIIFMALNLTEQACKYINRRLGLSNDDIEEGSITISPGFDGSFPTAHNTIFDGVSAADLTGQMAGCVEEGSINSYHYFHVLVVR